VISANRIKLLFKNQLLINYIATEK